MDSFATIPAEIERRVAAGERVALIMIDGLGAELLARYEHHPFSRRLALTSLRSQFPATTTAHVTTIHYGLAVEQHGLYEWNLLEPSLGELICPLMFEVAGGRRQDGLTGRLDPRCWRRVRRCISGSRRGRWSFNPTTSAARSTR